MDACSAGEQTLIARLVAGHPEIFQGRAFVVNRNFLGYELTTAILDAGGHLVMRVKQGISLPAVPGGWLSDGSRMSYLNAPGRAADRLPVRVAEHNVTVPGSGGETVSELYCLATTLLDHQRFPARGDPGGLPAAVECLGDHHRGEQDHGDRCRAVHRASPSLR